MRFALVSSLLAGFAVALLPFRVHGQLASDSIPARAPTAASYTLRFFVDNDVLSLRAKGVPNDFDYTHGMGVSADWGEAPLWLRRRLGDRDGCSSGVEPGSRGCLMSSLSARQAIFTPPSNGSRPVMGERPYAGYLGATAGATLVRVGMMRRVAIELGTTGPLSLAEPIQGLVHKWTRSMPELGWDNQLAARPTMLVRYEELRNRDHLARTTSARSALRWSAELGTLRTAATFGGELRVALKHAPLWLPDDGARAQSTGPFVLVALQQELVLRDVFIDGHFFNESITSRRIPLVRQATLGAGWRLDLATFEFRWVDRTREYHAQPRAHRYGTLSVTLHRRAPRGTGTDDATAP